jgi:hypothetical protein
MNEDNRETRLEIREEGFVFFDKNGRRQVFEEGPQSNESKLRQARIQKALADGYIGDQIRHCKRANGELLRADEVACELLSSLVESITEQFGRAVVGVLFLQLTIKSIEPEQSIRLHKSGDNSDDFSWVEGISMRTLDKRFSTPALREYGLLSLNADGCFMTRTLAENYPYTRLYKAAIRGSKDQWLQMVDRVETGESESKACLHFLIGLLLNRSTSFHEAAHLAMEHVNELSTEVSSVDAVAETLLEFCSSSTNPARLFEVAIHSLCQVIYQHGGYQGVLKPLSQMRSANKKHGNLGDIEILEVADKMRIAISWDAKYGKTYLRYEIDELEEKLRLHPETKLAGFITDSFPELHEDVAGKVSEVESKSKEGLRIEITDFRTWANAQTCNLTVSAQTVAVEWLVAFAECICQRRRQVAPIDEPADAWVNDLKTLKLSRRYRHYRAAP